MLLNSTIVQSLELINTMTVMQNRNFKNQRGFSTERSLRSQKFYFENNFEFKINTYKPIIAKKQEKCKVGKRILKTLDNPQVIMAPVFKSIQID